MLRASQAGLPPTASFSNTQTSGTNAATTIDLAVSPLAASIQVAIAHRVTINYNSSQNMLAGGYLLPIQAVINTAGTGTHDKLVAMYSQLNLTGGNVAAAVGFESNIPTIGALTAISGLAGFLFANHRGVPNIGNIGTLAAFSNQDPVAIMVSAGPYVNADLRELSPSKSAGVLAGRYYSAPCGATGPQIVATSVIYVTYVHIPHRCTPTKLGVNVTTGLAGNVILGLYKVQDNMLTTMVMQTASLSTAVAGAVEGTVSTQVDSGMYALVATFSSAVTVTWHTIVSCDRIGMSSPTGFFEYAFITPFAFGALPATANIIPTYAANTVEPHLWWRA